MVIIKISSNNFFAENGLMTQNQQQSSMDAMTKQHGLPRDGYAQWKNELNDYVEKK
jgi:hypothetical protein